MVNKEDILKRTTQEIIFRYYLPWEFSFKKKYINPFRNDKNPGCNFKYSKSGVLYFTDWAFNEQYDCFQFASKITQIDNFQKLLQKIDKDLQLNVRPTSLKIPKKMNITNEQPKEDFIFIKNTLYNYEKKKNFSESDLKFWDKEKIKPKTLEYFRVESLDRFVINDFIIQSSVHYPIFKYNLEEGQYQIYCPKNQVRFYSVKKPYYLMGFDLLPHYADNIVITSSYKDVMQLFQIGIPAVAPDSESNGILRSDLERLFKRFKNVYINYNNDDAGIKATNSLIKKFSDLPLKVIFNRGGKDPTEVNKNLSEQELINQYKEHGII